MSHSVFAHVVAEKTTLYRAVMRVFSEAKAHFVVHLRPEDVMARLEGTSLEDLQPALDQLVHWGNLQAEPDTTRVTSVEDFYRARFLYQITREGEAAEQALATFDRELGRRGALQAVALEDIRSRLQALGVLAEQADPDPAQVHLALRDLAAVFTGLAENARAFMSGLGRTLDLRGNREAFLAYKERLIEYIERFIGDLVTASAEIAGQIGRLEGPGAPRPIDALLAIAATREAEDQAPDPESVDGQKDREALVRDALAGWQAHWSGLTAWFVGGTERPSQASLLRARARRAISQLLEAVVRLNERRLGRSDRTADFRTLARWFLECESEGEAHRLWRAAFGLAPARHLTLDAESLAERQAHPVGPGTSWAEAPPLRVSPRLRETGSHRRRGPPPTLQRRDRERALLARELAAEAAEARAARARLATGRDGRLSELGDLDAPGFRFFLQLLGEALSAARSPEEPVSTVTGDGSLALELTPVEPPGRAAIATPAGVFGGRDYRLRITALGEDRDR